MENRINSLKDLFVDQIADLLSAENQLISALPKLANSARNEDLKEAILDHLEETRGHADRIKQVFQIIGEPVKAKTCKAMQGLIQETEEFVNQSGEPTVLDAGIIACAQRVEHYEIAAYGCVCAYAKLLDYDDAKSLLDDTLDEEENADDKLNKIAEGKVNKEALKVSA